MPESKPTNEAFEAFRDFAKRVVSVPKTEIDRREAAYQKARKGPRKAKA